MNDDYDDLLADVDDKLRKDVKYNIFRFQDHLLQWINYVAHFFINRDYPSTFEALQNVYMDCCGSFTTDEITTLDELQKTAQQDYIKYIQYNIDYQTIKKKVKQYAYLPPTNFYASLIKFRTELMKTMWKHQLLIPTVQKGTAGAGSG